MPTDTNFAKIIDALGLDALEMEEQEEILLSLGDLIFKDTLVRLIEKMDDETRDTFSALIEHGATEDEVSAFLQANVPTADAIVKEAVGELADDILAVTH